MKVARQPFRFRRIRRIKTFFVLLNFFVLISHLYVLTGQITFGAITGATPLNAIPTSVPFLTIAPDGRSSGMGDVGAASAPDINSQHWNAAKYAFLKGEGGVALTYAPWLSNLVPDIEQLYFTGFYRINAKNTLSSSLRYLSLGRIYFTSIGGASAGNFYAREFALDAGYSHSFTPHLSGGVVLRYIHSNPRAAPATGGGQDYTAGTSVAGDLGIYYQKDIQLGEKMAQWALGLNFSNLGTPVSYAEDQPRTPIPSNLRLGGRFSYEFNSEHSLSFHADINKLLVPTPGVYREDSLSGDLVLVRGKESPGSVILGMFQSLYDAPGVLRPDGTYSVLAEEIHELQFGLGAEYYFRKMFAIRTGYFHEHDTKGNRKYFTLGAGVSYSLLTFDLSYLVPVQGPSSPLYNTFRLALSAKFG